MDERVSFILGILIGFAVYWIIYGAYLRRWRSSLEKDLSYYRAKYKSTEDSNFGLERQLAVQRAELPALEKKIGDLERENRKLQIQLDAANHEKQAQGVYADALRVELETYKRLATEPLMPPPSLPQRPLPQRPMPQRPLPQRPMPQRSNGSIGRTHAAVPADCAITSGMIPLPEGFPLPNGVPVPSAAAPWHGNGPASQREAPRKPSSSSSGGSGSAADNLPIDQLLTEPPLIIARPWIGGDRLEIIQGIGPAVAQKLNRAGVDSFQALSSLAPARLREIVGGRAASLMDADDIIRQAKKLVGERNRRK